MVDPATAATVDAIRVTPMVKELIYDSVNALASEPTIDAMAAAAGADARAVVMGLAADIAEGAEPSTPTTSAFFAAVPDPVAVDWTLIGEAVLLDVITGVDTGE